MLVSSKVCCKPSRGPNTSNYSTTVPVYCIRSNLRVSIPFGRRATQQFCLANSSKKSNMMPAGHFPPPASMFLVYNYSLLISSLHIASYSLPVNQDAVSCIPLPPTSLIFNLATFEENNRNILLIRTLLPHFHGMRRGTDCGNP